MKRRKLLITWTALQAGISLITFTLTLLLSQSDAAIVPPPWSDPEKNPCASMPGGWQLLYWPQLKKCFKIFTIGYPCPPTMELSPTATNGKKKSAMLNAPAAECRCPPGTALSTETNECHTLYERGPCEYAHFFQPLPDSGARQRSNRWGTCKPTRQCTNDMIYWPKDGKCYTQYTKGPCIKGKLLVLNSDGLAECKCEAEGKLNNYYYELEGSCHEHFTKGPCSTPGHLFLPGGYCDCRRQLPHYDEQQQMCFELNTPGPCSPGHIFSIPDSYNELDESPRAKCQCKEGYVPWSDGNCYRLYTRGPCANDEFLVNATSCVHNFCGKSRLYFPEQRTCYRIGSQGPCSLHQVVVFDFTARPSVDGISYNGMCGCSGVITNLDQQCDSPEQTEMQNTCEATPGMVEINGNCYKLYTRGPCGPGQWLAPLKTEVTDPPPLPTRALQSKAKCVCRPGYTRDEQSDAKSHDGDDSDDNDKGRNNAALIVLHGVERCNAPTVGLARWFLEIFG